MAYRKHVNKRRSAKNFRRSTMKTRKINIAANMRGGIRL
ncbi:MAG: hypothetical protein [Arizlama microvirus]|nr:MAG: hypothetical protein [Arizlama microvirus]